MPLIPAPSNFMNTALRVITSVLTMDGPIAPVQSAILEFGQKHLHHTELDLGSLLPITPEELAPLVPAGLPAAFTRQFVQSLVMLSLAGVEVSPHKAARVRSFAKVLGIDDPLLDNLKQLSERRLALLRFDYQRRSQPFTKVPEKPEGLLGTLRALGHMKGLIEDHELAERYRALEKLTPGTLGRSLFDFYRAHNFSLPGEKYGAPEVVVRHDLTHVIGGYETDHAGEAQVLAFQAGGRREGAMEVLVFLMFQVQVGVQVVNLAEPSAGFLHNEESGRKVARAFLRGSAMNLDLLGDWDFKSAFHRPLEELRREYNVLPESAFAGEPD